VVRFTADSDQDCALQSAEGRRLAERLAERKNVTHSEAVRVLDPASADARHQGDQS